MTQAYQFQNQLDQSFDELQRVRNQNANPQQAMQQFMDDVEAMGGISQPVEQKRSWMPALVGAGLGTAVGALAGNGEWQNAALGGLVGGTAGYASENKKRNDYIKSVRDKNNDILKSVLPTFAGTYTAGKQASTLNTLSTALKTLGETSGAKNVGDMVYNNLPPELSGLKPKTQAPQLSPEVQNAQNIIKSYGGMQSIANLMPNLSQQENNYLQEQIDIINNQPLTGAAQADNRPLVMGKLSDVESRIKTPEQVKSIKAQTQQRQTAAQANVARTNYTNRKTAEVGKTKPSSKTESEKSKLQKTAADVRAEWDDNLNGYKAKYGKSPTSQQKAAVKNVLRQKYGNQAFYSVEKELR